jgi:small subunit ribosomal protein S18
MNEELLKEQAGASAAAPRLDKDAPEPGQKLRSKRRRKVSYLTLNKIDYVDYKEVAVLKRFLNDRGKMLPSRQTGNTASQQRMIAESIKRAREMALIPFVVTDMSADRGAGFRRERPRRDEAATQEATE